MKKVRRNKNEAFASSLFDESIKKFPNKIPLDTIEFRIAEIDALIIEESRATLSVSRMNAFLAEHDRKALRSMFTESLNRIFIRPMGLPQLIEDVMAFRETAKLLKDDYLYYMYAKTAGRKPESFADYLSLSAPWVAFYAVDSTAAEMLHQLTRNKAYEAKAKSLFEALKRNLWIDSNLEKALKKYRRLDAGSKIQMGELGAVPGIQQRQRV
ncbi:MAG: hypothetical protein HYW26_01835 [Candidatus Aenigmarchaeota archaeon]|nr:hypothetical protein [Candidatus Aenigmarchaeota archaeon]